MAEPDVILALLLSSPTSVAGSLVLFEELPHAGARRIAFALSHHVTALCADFGRNRCVHITG